MLFSFIPLGVVVLLGNHVDDSIVCTYRVAVLVSFIEFVHNLNPEGEVGSGLIGTGTRIPMR